MPQCIKTLHCSKRLQNVISLCIFPSWRETWPGHVPWDSLRKVLEFWKSSEHKWSCSRNVIMVWMSYDLWELGLSGTHRDSCLGTEDIHSPHTAQIQTCDRDREEERHNRERRRAWAGEGVRKRTRGWQSFFCEPLPEWSL